MTSIGTLRETALHAALKEWLKQPGDELEASVDGFQIDLRRGEELIEIQTRNFAAIRRKLARLLDTHPVRLVHPIPEQRYIVKLEGRARRTASRRKSPRRGDWLALFSELTAIPHLVAHPNFTLEIVITQEEEVRVKGRGGWRRRGWKVLDRRLLQVVATMRFSSPADYVARLPPTLPSPFTTRQLAAALGCQVRLAQQVAYCLRRMAAVQPVGKVGNAILYQLTPPNA